MGVPASKLRLEGARTTISMEEGIALASRIFLALGCSRELAEMVAAHLAEADLSGVESHGLMRTLQYAEQLRSGTLDPKAQPCLSQLPGGGLEVDGRGGIGIPAMELATEEACRRAAEAGLTAIAVRNAGHTGRLGAFAEKAAEEGFLTIMMGGGNRQTWRQVAPHGGRKAMLPTNPYCIGIPGGELGPVILDFATSKIAGGWIYAAKSAGARLPEGCVIDAEGHLTDDPEAYFQGGAILPAGGAKGYALALVAELIGEALLGPATTECNWLLLALDTTRYRAPDAMGAVAEEILSELRACPPAPGFQKVEIPGERERAARKAAGGKIALPEKTWNDIRALAESLGVSIGNEGHDNR